MHKQSDFVNWDGVLLALNSLYVNIESKAVQQAKARVSATSICMHMRHSQLHRPGLACIHMVAWASCTALLSMLTFQHLLTSARGADSVATAAGRGATLNPPDARSCSVHSQYQSEYVSNVSPSTIKMVYCS